MKKETLFIAFSTQKGGVGKTTLTVLAASWLHYVCGYNVAITDCDYPQHSITDMRKRDVAQVTGDDRYKRLAHTQFTALKKKAYPIEESKAADAVGIAEALQQAGDLDFYLFRPARNVEQRGSYKNIGGDGLNFRTRQRRPSCVGKYPCFER
jgi:cellulose biosynthesis protein BcsQ